MADSGGTPPGTASRQAVARSPDIGVSSADPTPEVISKVAEILRPLIRDPNQASQAVAKVVAAAEMFSGPLPHPQHLQAYEAIAPGIAKQIIDMAAKEQRHRHKMQTWEMAYPYFGGIAGLASFNFCMSVSAWLGMNDHQTLALAMLAPPCVGVIGWFVRSRITLAKDEAMPPPEKIDGKINNKKAKH